MCIASFTIKTVSRNDKDNPLFPQNIQFYNYFNTFLHIKTTIINTVLLIVTYIHPLLLSLSPLFHLNSLYLYLTMKR